MYNEIQNLLEVEKKNETKPVTENIKMLRRITLLGQTMVLNQLIKMMVIQLDLEILHTDSNYIQKTKVSFIRMAFIEIGKEARRTIEQWQAMAEQGTTKTCLVMVKKFGQHIVYGCQKIGNQLETQKHSFSSIQTKDLILRYCILK